MNRLPRAGALIAVILSAGCGAARIALPSGPGSPAADAVDVLRQATARCREVRSYSAELAVSGRANGQRLRGRVLVGLAAPASALLDATAPFGASIFIYAATDGRVTLLLPRDRRVLQDDDPAAVLEAVTGVPLDPTDLRRMLTGCVPDPEPGGGRAFGASWRAVPVAGGEAFLRREGDAAPWRLVAVTHGQGAAGWRAEFSSFEGALPSTIRLESGDGGRRFNLRLVLSQAEVNPGLAPEVFEIRVPASADPISLEELRRSGPLGAPGDS